MTFDQKKHGSPPHRFPHLPRDSRNRRCPVSGRFTRQFTRRGRRTDIARDALGIWRQLVHFGIRRGHLGETPYLLLSEFRIGAISCLGVRGGAPSPSRLMRESIIPPFDSRSNPSLSPLSTGELSSSHDNYSFLS